jgi:hypothetical protein
MKEGEKEYKKVKKIEGMKEGEKEYKKVKKKLRNEGGRERI